MTVHTMMPPAEFIRLLAERHPSRRHLSRAAQIDPTTLRRALRPGSRIEVKLSTLQQLAQAVGADVVVVLPPQSGAHALLSRDKRKQNAGTHAA